MLLDLATEDLWCYSLSVNSAWQSFLHTQPIQQKHSKFQTQNSILFNYALINFNVPYSGLKFTVSYMQDHPYCNSIVYVMPTASYWKAPCLSLR